MANWQIGLDSGSLITLPKHSLVSVPVPSGIGGAHTAVNGAGSLDYVGRKWGLTWTWANLADTELALIEQFGLRTIGVGPFIVSDPAMEAGALKTMNVLTYQANPKRLNLSAPAIVFAEV